MSVFEGIRVLDCSGGVAGPLAAMAFSDFGADVVKVEPPGGAPTYDEIGSAVWDRGKRSVVLDLGDPADEQRLEALLAGADVCITSRPVDDLAGTPLDPATAGAANPRLVYLHMPPYTATTPWAGGDPSDSLLAARTGIAIRQVSVEDVPVDSVYRHLSTVQGSWAAAAATAALIERERSGLGQVVTVGGIHGAMIAAAALFSFDPGIPEPPSLRPGGAGGPIPFYRLYQCGDGEWLFLAALTPRFSEVAFLALGLPELITDPRLEGRGRAGLIDPAQAGWVIETVAEVFRTKPRDEWLEILRAADVPVGALLDRGDWLDHPQLAAIGMRVEVEDVERGRVVMPGIPVRLTVSPGEVKGPAPRRGGSDLPDWAPRPTPTTTSPAAATSGNGPLDGIRVLDLGAIIAGPYAASLLGELGADVIKIEPLTGDSFRGPGFAAYNKGQRGIALDLRHPDGHDVFIELVRGADIVIDNYRPGVLGRLGLRYEDLRQVTPDIITLSMTGFGEGGPLGMEAGFDPVLQAMSGMMGAQGGEDDPVFFTVPVNDVTGAANGALGACLALLHRTRTGEGQRVWTSLAAMSALLQAGEITRWEGKPEARVGGRDHAGPSDLDRYHQVADGFVRIHAGPDEAERLKPLLGELSRLTTDEAVAKLNASGVPAAAARRPAELLADPELEEIGALHHDPRPGRQQFITAGRHALFSRTQRAETLVSPSLGEHTREVLVEAGIPAERVEELVAAGVASARAVR